MNDIILKKITDSMSAKGLAFILCADGKPLKYRSVTVSLNTNAISGNVTIFVDGVACAEVHAAAPARALIEGIEVGSSLHFMDKGACEL